MFTVRVAVSLGFRLEYSLWTSIQAEAGMPNAGMPKRLNHNLNPNPKNVRHSWRSPRFVFRRSALRAVPDYSVFRIIPNSQMKWAIYSLTVTLTLDIRHT